MAGISQSQANSILNVLRNTAYAAIAQPYLALCTSAPTLTTPGTEVTGGGYARQAITFAAPANSGTNQQIQNSGALTFPTGSGNGGGNITYWQIYDAATVGNALFYGILQGANDLQTISTSGQLTAGTYTLTFSGQTTPAINFNDTAARITELLESLSNIGAGNVTAAFTGNRFDQASPGTLGITFGGSLQYASQAVITITPTGITGGTLSNAHTTTGSTGAITPGVNVAPTVAINAITCQIG